MTFRHLPGSEQIGTCGQCDEPIWSHRDLRRRAWRLPDGTVACTECYLLLGSPRPAPETWYEAANGEPVEHVAARYLELLGQVRAAVGPDRQDLITELVAVVDNRVNTAWNAAWNASLAGDEQLDPVVDQHVLLQGEGLDQPAHDGSRPAEDDLDEADRVELLERRVDRIEEIIAQVATAAAGIERSPV